MQTHVHESAVRRRSGGPVLNVFGVQARVLADGAMTGGASSIAALTCPPGAGAPPHRHAQTENFHVLQGTLEVMLDGDWQALGGGDFVHVAPGRLHAFRNSGTEPVEFLAIATPSGHEQFFVDMDGLAARGAFTLPEALAVCHRHGIEVLVEGAPPEAAERPAAASDAG